MDAAATHAYLAAHFLTPSELAARVGIDCDRLRALVDDGLVPHPSYTATDDRLLSVAFGSLACPGLEPGAYFHHGMALWVDAAQRATTASGGDRETARAALREAFTAEATDALMRLTDDGLRPLDCLDARGHVDHDAVRQRIASHWQAHLGGIFGVCVRRPDSIAQIVLKETLQSVLTQATDNGTRTEYPAAEAAWLHTLAARFADACAPFAPVEYPRSSRKRFVEDLAARLGQSAPVPG